MRLCYIFIFIFSQLKMNAQELNRNKMWVMGYFPAVTMDFNKANKIDTFENKFKTLPYPEFTFGLSNICDTNGKLLFSCNGFIAYDKNGFGMDNWNLINCPFGTKLRTALGHDGLYNQMSIILPKVNNEYYLFTTGMSDKAFDEWQSPNATFDSFRFDNLNYAIVDMNVNNGAGKVIEKNIVLLQDAYLSHVRMTAVKLGNGKDWWLVKPHKTKQLFYNFLISANGIAEPIISTIPEYIDMSIGNDGQSTFSNNGSLYAYTTSDYTAEYYVNNFDRCTGLMTKFKHITVPNDLPKYGNDWCEGVAFSPNDSLLYVSTQYSIWQVDLYDTNAINYIKIADPDTLLDYFPRYQAMALAPDNKIYIGNNNGIRRSRDYIEFPNIKGVGCGFRGRGNGAIISPYSNLLVPPNMPNYGLGVLKGSPCDTIRAQINNWLLYPNPANDFVKLKVPNSSNGQSVTIQIFDMLGKLIVQSIRAINYEHEAIINTSNLANGLYILKANSEGKEFIGIFVKE
jgi:hypothetical protein